MKRVLSPAVLTYFTHPLLLALLSQCLWRERLAPERLVLAALNLGSLALVLNGGTEQPDPTGVCLAVLASVAVLCMILLSAEAQQTAGTLEVNMIMTAVTVLIFALPVTVGHTWSPPAGLVGWLGLVGAGVGVAIGLLAFFAAFRFIGPVRARMLSTAEPLFGILFAVAVLGKRLSPRQWTGVALAVLTLVLLVMPERNRVTQPNR